MKSHFTLFFLMVTIFFSACKKDETEPIIHLRGDLESAKLLTVLSAEGLKQAIALMMPTIISNVNFNYNVSVYKIKYYTNDTQGKVVLASGLLTVPKSDGKAFPLLGYFHGTSAIKTDVPSALNTEAYLGYLMSTEGFVSVLPDYLGLGDSPGMHPYLHAESEASCSIDLLLVCKELSKTLNFQLNDQTFLCGYSQGGHVTMAVQKMIEELYPTKFTITASAPMAGPYDMSGVQKSVLLSKKTYPEPVYLPYLLYSYQTVYNLVPDITSVFQPSYAANISKYFTTSGFTDINKLKNEMPSSGIPLDMLTTEFAASILEPTSAINLAMAKNDLYNWTPKAPMKLCHCDADEHVPMANSTKAVESFKTKGVTVELVNPLPGGTHLTCIIPSFIYVKNWFGTLKN